MVKFTTVEDRSDLSVYEMSILLLSAYLHDIGMVPERAKRDAHEHFLLTGNQGDLTPEQVSEFQLWLDDDERGISIPLSTGTPTSNTLSLADELTAFYIRSQHNAWSREWIEQHQADSPTLYDNWLDDLILICQSHHWGRDRLASAEFNCQIRGADTQLVHLRYLACILRIADILENDPERTPDVLFKHRGVDRESELHWFRNHFLTIEVNATSVNLDARPKSALQHKALLEMAAEINRELADCAWLRDHSDLNTHPATAHPLTRRWQLEPSARVDVCEAEDADYQFIDAPFNQEWIAYSL